MGGGAGPKAWQARVSAGHLQPPQQGPPNGPQRRIYHPTHPPASAAFPVHAPDYAAFSSAPPGSVSAIWAGHASVLFRLEGLTVLTDPVFAKRASPLPFLGPRRAVAAAVEVEDDRLPRIDAVCVSHNHYDHLCAATVKRLHR